jgi:hypothetical protein
MPVKDDEEKRTSRWVSSAARGAWEFGNNEWMECQLLGDSWKLKQPVSLPVDLTAACHVMPRAVRTSERPWALA